MLLKNGASARSLATGPHRRVSRRGTVDGDSRLARLAHLDANFFRVRLDRLPPLQRKYLRAMAELGDVR